MVNTYSQNMVGGMLGLLRYCPQEVAHLRKELLIAARHILATDLRKVSGRISDNFECLMQWQLWDFDWARGRCK